MNEAQLGHRLDELETIGLDPSWNKANHTLAVLVAITDLIYQLPPESNFEGDREVYMVGQG
jgi:hypothetical protein